MGLRYKIFTEISEAKKCFIIIKPYLQYIDEDRIYLEDASFIDNVDRIICATGYRFDYSFLENEKVRKVPIIKFLNYRVIVWGVSDYFFFHLLQKIIKFKI